MEGKKTEKVSRFEASSYIVYNGDVLLCYHTTNGDHWSLLKGMDAAHNVHSEIGCKLSSKFYVIE